MKLLFQTYKPRWIVKQLSPARMTPEHTRNPTRTIESPTVKVVGSHSCLQPTSTPPQLPFLLLFTLVFLSWANSVISLPQQDMYAAQNQRPTFECHEEWQWMCDDEKECIARYDVCDGIAQCRDGSDENDKYCRKNRLVSKAKGLMFHT
jgi:hypothetical protein